jgi:hypothetical protein
MREYVAIIFSALIVINIVVAGRGLAFIMIVCFSFWLLSPFVPLDLALRKGSGFSVKVVPVKSRFHGRGSVREAASQGLIQNVDFVVYHCTGQFVTIRRAILVTLPVPFDIPTPLFSPLQKSTKAAPPGSATNRTSTGR